MTTFQQALHIFRKDVRHLRFEIAGVMLLLVVLILTGVQTWEGLQERGGPQSDADGPLVLLLPLAWSLLIARAIQTEALPGDRHFWLTRPYSRQGLLLSKTLLIVAFINLPLLAAQAAIVSLDGLPLLSNLGGLLWNQVLISVLLLLPVAAVAALTRNLAYFLPVVVLTAALLAGPVGLASDAHHSMGDLEWIRSSVGLFIGAAIGVFVLWRQYRLRRSVNTAMLAAGSTMAGMILYLAFPQSLAFAIQSRVIGSPDGKFGLRLRQSERSTKNLKDANRYRQLVALPIAVTGADPRDLRVDSSEITLKTLSGITRHTSARVTLAEQQLVLTTSLDRTFFDAAKDSPVNLRAAFYLTQFSNARSINVSMDGTPAYIPGPGQCGVVAGYERRTFVCRSVFQAPRPFISDRVAREHSYHRWSDSYSPFPSLPRLNPVIAETYELLGRASDDLAPAVPEHPATLVVRDPVAYFRYTMETPDVRLGDFAITKPKEDKEQ
jgi:hypothetical protein